MQNEVDNSGIKGIEEQDLGTVTVNPNKEKTESAFPQFTDEAKRTRGIEEFKSFKKGFKQALPYLGQLGLDLVPGSGITEIFGKQPDIVEGGQRPSFAGQVERTTELAKEGKTTEAIVSGVDTALTGAAGVGEGIMVAGAMTGPLAPLLVGAGFAIKGLAKGGKLILQSTKTGKKILANYDGDAQVGFSIKDVEVPKDVESDPDIQTLEDTIDIPTTKTDDTDTEVAIPELAQDLNTTEAITGYVVAPDKLDRNQLIAKIENDPEVKTKTDKYLEEQGVSGDTVPIYRFIAVTDKVKKRLGFDPIPEVTKKAEVGQESIISGSLSPSSNIKTTRFIDEKVPINASTEIVRYDVPREKIKLAIGGFKNDIKQNVNKKLKEKGFGQNKVAGQTVTNPSKTAKKLIDMQDEIIADVTGLEKKVLVKGPSIKQNEIISEANKILKGEIKTYQDFKNQKGEGYFALNRDEMRGLSKQEFDIANDKALENEANKITDFYGLPRLGAPKQDEGIKALEPNKLDYSPKEEIKDKGGFVFTDKKIEEMQQKLNVRLTKMAKGEKTAGEPSNKKIVLKSDNPDNPDFVVGDITPEEWVKRTNALVSKEKAMKAKDWYKKVYNYFLKVPGLKNEEEAKTLAQAWFASQQNASPREGLKNVLSIRQLLQEGKTAEDIMAMKSIPFGGTPSANSAILSVLVPETKVKGVGSKISDFRDNLDGKNVRSILGNKKEGGSPFVVDVHTARDSGLVDPALINFLKAKGYKIPKDIKIDFAGMGVPTDKYENRSIWGQELTKYVNEIKWLGKDDWKTEEVQAIGWTGLTDWYGGVNTGGDITSALEGSLQRISMEVKPGDGSPWDVMFGKDFSNLSPEKQIEINDKITDEAIKMVSKSENVDLTSSVFGTGGWQTFINPSTIQQAILTRPKAIRVAAKLGMLLNQTEVWVNSTKGLTKNPQNMAIDIIEEGSTNFKDSKFINDMFSDLFKKTNGLIEGFQPIETLGGEVGIRVIITKDAMKKFGKDNKLNLKQVQNKIENLDLNNLLKDYDFKMRYGILESELDILRNDWRKNKDGSDYKKNYISRGDDSRTPQDGKDFDIDKQKLTDIFRQEIRNAQGTKRPDTEEVLVSEDIGTVDIPKKSIGGFIERNTYDWVYLDG